MNVLWGRTAYYTPRAFDRIIDLSAAAGAVGIAVMMLTIGYEVLSRRVFNAPTAWALPVTEFALLYVTMLAVPIVLRRDGHVRMTALVEQLGPRTKRWLDVAGSITGFIVMGVLAWKMFGATLEEFRSGAALIRGIEVPRAAITWILPYGLTLLSLQFLRMAYRGVVRGESQADADTEAGI